MSSRSGRSRAAASDDAASDRPAPSAAVRPGSPIRAMTVRQRPGRPAPGATAGCICQAGWCAATLSLGERVVGPAGHEQHAASVATAGAKVERQRVFGGVAADAAACAKSSGNAVDRARVAVGTSWPCSSVARGERTRRRAPCSRRNGVRGAASVLRSDRPRRRRGCVDGDQLQRDRRTAPPRARW